jgi:hypothetical protein
VNVAINGLSFRLFVSADDAVNSPVESAFLFQIWPAGGVLPAKEGENEQSRLDGC